MPIGFPVSRRALLKTAVSGLATVLASIPALRTRAEEQVSKPDANYQDRPNGIQRCEICLQFKPPNRCQLVQGDISPKGWCQYFAARENAR